MSRLLFFAAIIVIVYLWLKSVRKPSAREDDASGPAEDMVRCEHCGVHLPRNESILADGKRYCSEAHRLAHAAGSK